MIYILLQSHRLKLKRINLKLQKQYNSFVYFACFVLRWWLDSSKSYLAYNQSETIMSNRQDCFSEHKLQPDFAVVMFDFYSALFRSGQWIENPSRIRVSRNPVIMLKRIEHLVSPFIIVSDLCSVLIATWYFRSTRSPRLPPSDPNRVSFQCQNDRWREIIEVKRHKANNDIVTVRSSSETLCALIYFPWVKSHSEYMRRDRSDQNTLSDAVPIAVIC